MAAGLDGNVDIGLDLETKPAAKALDNFRKKMRGTFAGNDAKALDRTIKETEKTIKALEREIDKTKDKLREMGESDAPPKSVQNLEKELKKSEKEMQKLDAEFAKLAKEQQELADRQVPGLTLEESLTPEQYARFQELDALIIKNGHDTDALQAKIDALKSKLAEVEANPQATDEAKKLNRELDDATKELEKQKQKYSQLKKEQLGFTEAAVPGMDSVKNAVKRIGTMLKRVFVFGVILKGIRGVASAMKNALIQNNQFASSLNQIKGNLLTAAAPIYNALVPAFLAIINVIKVATQYLAQFISLLTGTSITANKKAAKALYEQAGAAKAAGNANKKASKDAEKSALSFDELNTISSPAEDTSGGGSTSVKPFETSDLTITDEIKGRIEAILVLVGAIGGALLAWKITTFVTDLMAAEAKLKMFQSGFGKLIGIAMIVAGAILLIKNYCDAWVNGLDWGNFLGIITGLALVVGGLVLVLGTSVAPFALIGAGIAALVLGVKDFIENGPNFQNILLIIIGLAAIFAAVWLLASAPIAILVTAIVALVAIFVILWNKCEGFREFWIGLWENIKEAAITVWEEYIKPTLDYMGEQFTKLWEEYIKPMWEDHLKPALEAIGTKLKELWDTVIWPVLKWIGEKIGWLWENILSPFIQNFLIPLFVGGFKNAFDNIMSLVKTVITWFGEKIDAIKNIFSGLIDFVTGVFTGNWGKALNGIKTAFGGIIDSIKADFKGMVNVVITMINGFIKGINLAIDLINKIPGVDIPKLKEIPKLAKGAVIPPNQEFLAVLGDQKHGTNIETPLSTMIEAFETALSRNGYSSSGDININFTGNLAQLARILNPVIEKEKKRVGPKLVTGGAY